MKIAKSLFLLSRSVRATGSISKKRCAHDTRRECDGDSDGRVRCWLFNSNNAALEVKPNPIL